MAANIKTKPNFLKCFVAYVCGFVLIYYTNVLPNINPYLFPIFTFGIIALMEIANKKNSIFAIARKKKYLFFIIGLTLAALYYVLVHVLMNDQVSVYSTRIVQSMMFVVYFFLTLYYIKRIHTIFPTREEKLELLFRIASIQGIICILMLIIPSFKQMADNLFILNSNFESGDYILLTRVFGISNSYTYGLPILHGLLTGLCFYMSTVFDKKYFKYLPFIAIVSVLNGRTGVLVAIITTVLSMLYAFLISKNKMRVLKLSVLSVVIATVSILLIGNLFPKIQNFINSAFNGIGDYFSNGEVSASIKPLTGDSIHFPEGAHMIFGEGARVYSTVNNTQHASTDIGFVNDLFMGGLIYVGLLYGSYFGLIFSSFEDKRYRFMKYLILVSLVIANWKGEIFKNSLFIIGIFYIVLSGLTMDDGKENTKELEHETK